MHFGELEVIVGAKELGIDFAIIDEHAARKMASEFLIDTIGVLGILELGKNKRVNKFSKSLKWINLFLKAIEFQINYIIRF